MTREQAWTSYHMIYKPTVQYSLSACSFLEDQTLSIHKKALQAFLPRMGIAVTFPRAVVHGSFTYGGINIPNLYSEQCASKLTSLITHIRAKSDLGQLLTLNINTIQLLTGLEKQFFVHNNEIKYIQTNWILHLRAYLQLCDIDISSKQFWTPQQERENDIGIMERAIQLYTDKNTLRQINNWRLYFQIIFLSDICNTWGTTILYEYRNYPTHHHFNYQRSSNLIWPNQGMPSVKCFKVWIRFLKEAFGANIQGQLRKSWVLGKWLVRQSQSLNTWAAYYSPGKNVLHRTDDYHYNIHKTLYSDRRKCIFERRSDDICLSVPQDATPATIIGAPINQFKTEIGVSKFTDETSLPSAPIGITFAQYLERQPTWRSDLCSKWTSTEDLGLLRHQLRDPSQLIQVATDGSVKQGVGCYGVVIAGMTGQKLFSTQGKMKNLFSPISIRRTESIGVLSALVILRSLHEFLHICSQDHGIIAIWCDNMSTVNMLKKFEKRKLTTNEHGAPDIDVILQIAEEMQQLQQYGYKIIINHIKAHQELPPDPDDPMRCAIELNKEADWLAGSAHIKPIIPHDNTSWYPAATIQIHCQNEPIHDGIHKKARDAYNDKPIIIYLQERFLWKTNTFDTIWWSIHGKTLQRFKPIHRLVIQKFNMDHWACNHRIAVRGDDEMKWCELCHHTEETSDHILQCPHITRQTARTELINDIDKYMKKSGTPKEMKNCIRQGILAWMTGNAPPVLETIVPNPSQTLRKAYTTQNTIGWRHFVKGRISIHWSTLVNGEPHDNVHGHDTPINGSNRNQESWGSGLIYTLWKHVLLFWKLRNDTEVEIYKQRGISKEHYTLIRTASKALQEGAVGHQHRDWMAKTPEDFQKMDVPSIKLWIRRIRASKRSFHKLSQIGQRDLLCYQIGTISLNDPNGQTTQDTQPNN